MGNTEEIKGLLTSGVDVNEQNNNEWKETALFGACRCGRAGTAKMLLKHRACIHYLSKERQSVLWFASSGGYTETVKLLLENGAPMNRPNNDELGNTALIGACQNGHINTTRILLNHGAYVDKQNKCGESALWYASGAGHVGVVKVLLESGAQVNLPNGWENDTALIIACQNGHSIVADELFKHGASADYQNKNGETSLTEACYHGKLESVTVLLRAGAKTDIQDKYGGSGLIWACYKGYVDIAKLLLEAKADTNITNENGWSALFFAATKGYLSLVKMLADYGTIGDLKDEYGLTALDYANDHPAVYDTLEQYTGQHIDSKIEITEEQRSRALKHPAVGQKFLNIITKTFLKEKVKKRDQLKMKQYQGSEIQYRKKV